jgi:hypothetical protein
MAITIDDVREYIQYLSGDEFELITLRNVSDALKTLRDRRMDELTQEGIDSNYIVDDVQYRNLEDAIDNIDYLIRDEQALKSALTGPRRTAKITSSIRLTNERSEGGKRKKRTRRHRKSRKARKSKKARKSRKY